MAGQKVSVDLVFKANTQAAKKNINDLSQSLFKIANMQFDPKISDKKILQASKSAQELSRHLNTAFNADTGKMDLVKFNQSLKSSQQTVQQLASSLIQAGQDGTQAFMQLSKAIANSETPMVKTNSLLNKMWVSLKNVATWQISSSLFNALTSSISEAYRFAQDLNESLTDIRIVTGYSADEMDRFAAKATKAAKTLSTTTNKYAKASLIYFQQGLKDEEVQERTDLTIKMANVTGQSVSEVSDQLTAVWNNFDDGTETLEHYVDVMVALGAATASSTDEISEGLNKFAAVAETVGLSYEYAASALATVTATTRQSADIVGTAFKTLFARVQDLELGETLDDGTTLGQYSQALAAVGIDIKDVNGDLKDMDVILEDMGARWNTLTKDQQVALAQNVAGVRQYTQLVALMDNWGYFQENLNTSLNSSGALQEQSEIYAEGWKAARDRVSASMEQLYQDILDDDFFIGFLNSIAVVIDEIDHMIDSLGGIGVVVSNLGAVFLNVFSNKISAAIQGTITQLQLASGKGMQKYIENTTSGINQVARDKIASGEITGAEKQSLEYDIETNKLKAKFMGKSGSMTDMEKEAAERQLEDIRKQQNQHLELLKVVEQLAQQRDKELKTLEEQIAAQKVLVSMEKERLEVEKARQQAKDIEANEAAYEKEQRMLTQTIEKLERRKQELAKTGASADDDDVYQRYLEDQERLEANIAARERNRQRLMDGTKNPRTNKGYTSADALERAQTLKTGSTAQQLAQEEKKRKSLLELYKKQRLEQTQHTKEILSTVKSVEQLDAEFKKVEQDTDWLEQDITLDADMAQLLSKTEGETIKVKDLRAELQKLGQSDGVDQIDADMQRLASSAEKAQREMLETSQQAEQVGQRAKDAADNFNPQHFTTGLEKITQSVASAVTIVTSITSLVNVFKSLGDESLTAGERVTGVIMGVISILPSLISGVMSLAASGLLLNAAFWWVTGIVAALAILAIGIAHIIDNTEKEKTALEKATEAAKNQQKALESITEAAEEMNDALQEAKDLIASYAEVSDAFDGLIKGSDAYNENLQKEIELVNQLLDKYPELLEMGVIGFQDGRYQVLDEDMLQQYVVGTATVDKLIMDLAKMYAKEDTEIDNEQVHYQEQRQKARQEQESASRLNYIETDYNRELSLQDAAGKQYGYEMTQEEYADSYQKYGYDPRAFWGAQIEEWANLYSSGNSLEDVKNYFEAYFQEYGMLDDKLYARTWGVFEEYVSNQEELNQKIKEVDEEHLDALAEINKQYEQQYKILGSQILSYQIGYSDLNQYQQAAASQQVGAQLAANNKKYEFKTGYGVDFNQELANYILKATGVGGAWSEYNGNDHNDIGDFFVNTVSGTEAIAAYLRDVKGYSDMTRDMLNNDGYTFDSEGMKSGEDSKYQFELDWAEIAAYYQSKAIYESMDYEAAMEAAAKRSNAANAAIGGTIGALSEEDISAIAYGNREDGYTLDTNSKAFREARAAMGAMTDEEQTSWVANLKQQIADYDAALAETLLLQQEMQEGNLILAESAEKYGLNADVVKNYAQSLYDANKAQGMSYTAAVNLAVANSRLAKGLETLREDWGDISDTLSTASKDSYEWMEAATEAQQALSDMFGVAVSVDFIDKYKEQIGILAEGGEEAVKVFQELEVAAGQDYIMSLAIDDEYKTEFKSMLEQLTEQETPEMKVGIKGEIDASYVQSLNKLLKEGAITADEVNAMFNSIGWDPNITTKPGDPVTNTSMSVITTGESFDPVTGNPIGSGTKSWQKIVTTTTPEVPVIGDVTSAPKSSSDIKTTTTSGSSKASKKKSIGRYHEIKEELADLQRELSKISKARESAFGSNRIALMDQEIAKQQELIDAENKYYKKLQENYKTDLNNLDSRFKLDENGRIKNYTQVLEDLIDQGVSGETYDAVKEAADQYEETLNELEAQQQAVNEETERLKELALEKIEYNIEFNIHLNERDLKQLEYQLKNLDDPIYDAAEALGVMGQMAQKNMDKIATYKQGIQEILGQELSEAQLDSFNNLLANMPTDRDITAELQDILGVESFSQDQITALEGYIDSLYDMSDVMDEFYDGITEKINTALDEMNEKSEKAIDRNEQLGKTLETYSNIIDLVGKKSLGVTEEQIRALGRAQVAQARYNLQLKQSQLEMNQNALANAQAARDTAEKAEDADAVKYWDEQIETIQDSVWALESEVESAWADTLQVIANDFTNAVEIATSAFEESMTGIYGSYDKMQEVFDQQKEISDRYVEDYQKIYELSKLNRDLNRSIDETDSVKGKQALRDLQKEINVLQESDTQMNEYGLEYLRKKYELRVAEIALEEAQNAKSQVRMQRDAEGNWGYVYTADESKVDSAQQNYEDKLYALQDFAQQHIDEMQELVISAEREMVEALNALRAEDFATQEEYQAEVARITEYYTGMRNYALDELNKTLEHSSEIYWTDWNNYSETTGYKISEEPKWRKEFTDTELAMVSGYFNIETARSTFAGNTEKMINGLTGAFNQWALDVEDAFKDVDKTFDNFAGEEGDLNKKVTAVNTELGKINTAFDSWKGSATTAFSNLITAAADNIDGFSEQMAEYKREIDNITKALTQMIKLSGTNLTESYLPEDTTPEGVTGGGGGGNTLDLNGGSNEGDRNDSNNEGDSNTLPVEYPITVYAEKLGRDGNILDKGLFNFSIKELNSVQRTYSGSSYLKLIKDGYRYDIAQEDYLNALRKTGWLSSRASNSALLNLQSPNSKFSYTSMDTGGYTGSWGSSGRLAMLHQKEIVLNAHDTENFLAAINIVRDIASAIDLRAMAYEHQLAQMAYAQIAPTAAQSLQQEVIIHAEFPNATQRTEIEAAFDTLLNRASQFANRKNK